MKNRCQLLEGAHPNLRTPLSRGHRREGEAVRHICLCLAPREGPRKPVSNSSRIRVGATHKYIYMHLIYPMGKRIFLIILSLSLILAPNTTIPRTVDSTTSPTYPDLYYLSDPTSDISRPIPWLDILEARITHIGSDRLQFCLTLKEGPPLTSSGWLLYCWGIDTDFDPDTGQPWGPVGLSTMSASDTAMEIGMVTSDKDR